MKNKKPKMVESLDDIELYKWSTLTTKIMTQALQEEKIKNRKLGIPAAFLKDGKILYELPDGTITNKSPWDKFKKSA